MVVSEGMSEAMRRLGEACLRVICPPPMLGPVAVSGCGGNGVLARELMLAGVPRVGRRLESWGILCILHCSGAQKEEHWHTRGS